MILIVKNVFNKRRSPNTKHTHTHTRSIGNNTYLWLRTQHPSPGRAFRCCAATRSYCTLIFASLGYCYLSAYSSQGAARIHKHTYLEPACYPRYNTTIHSSMDTCFTLKPSPSSLTQEVLKTARITPGKHHTSKGCFNAMPQRPLCTQHSANTPLYSTR